MLRRLALPVAFAAVLYGCGQSAMKDAPPSWDSQPAPTSAIRAEPPKTTMTLPSSSFVPSPAVKPRSDGPESTIRSPDSVDEREVRPNPLRVEAPSAGIDVPLDLLSLTATNELEVPKDPDRAGWWRSAKDQSPIVLVGHVDSMTGPAVFYRVREMKRGDDIFLKLSDGTTRAFVVTSKEQFRKDSFPTDSVYRAGSGELRLVTCGGSFNRRSHHYVDNVVVFARPV